VVTQDGRDWLHTVDKDGHFNLVACKLACMDDNSCTHFVYNTKKCWLKDARHPGSTLEATGTMINMLVWRDFDKCNPLNPNGRDPSCTNRCPPGTRVDPNQSPLVGDAVGNCLPCPAGTFSASPDARQCTPCPEDTFSAAAGASSCTKCPTGLVSFRGATRCLGRCNTGAVTSVQYVYHDVALAVRPCLCQLQLSDSVAAGMLSMRLQFELIGLTMRAEAAA
jgi:hypothetical protein